MSQVINQKDMREKNLVEVFDIIRKNDGLTRRTIESKTGLSWGGVSQIVSQLIAMHMVVERKQNDSASTGRTPVGLFANTDDHFVLGVDINLSGLTACVISADLQMKKFYRAAPCAEDAGALLRSIFELLDRVLKDNAGKRILAIGVSMQGRVNEQQGISVSLGRVKNWENVNIKEILQNRYSLVTYVAHDPDCLITAAGEEDSVLIRMDHGIGMAVKKNGKLITGEGMLELGKTVMDHKGSRLGDFVTLSAYENSSDQKEFLNHFVDSFSVSLANVLLLFDLRNVVLCGKMLPVMEPVLPLLKEKISMLCGYDVQIKTMDVTKAACGAAMIVFEKKKYRISL